MAKITELSNLLKTSHPDEMKFIKPWQPILGCVKKNHNNHKPGGRSNQQN